MNDLEKAQKLLITKLMPLKVVSNKSKISYDTIRQYASHPEKLEKAAWKKVYTLALIYDELVSELTK
ncbi:hypothetical protein AEL96_03295 [Lactobacillus crispatus]|uniref:hypothetical protein n=1 Tax=Lactobacillus crispatus TaxID=47770 RepID=UPI0007619AB7|nr:hypothetical protein [Lactobacillus crispatus]KWU06389.1 hypothetical protein AEL96_03295 [Lactobacillus crispatus]